MPPSYSAVYHRSLVLQAVREWRITGEMPDPDKITFRNLTWRTQVAHVHEHLEWIEQQLTGVITPSDEQPGA